MRVDRVNRRKVGKHFTIDIGEDRFSYHRNQDSITAEAALDGIYVLRTSVEPGDLDSSEIVSSCKALAQVERAFRAFSTDLDIRPIRHRTEDRARAHVFLRMLSYYITWHMHARLAPLLFTDDDKPAARAARQSPVASRCPLPAGPGQGSRQAHRRQRSRRSTAPPACWPTWPPSASTPSHPPTPTCPASGSSPPPPHSSGEPWTCSASATASGSRSQQRVQHITKAQVNGHLRGSLGGTSG